MRFYELTLSNPVNGKIIRQWSSYPGGSFDPGALNIMFDMPVSTGDTPVGAQTVMIEGIALDDLSNAQQFAAIVEGGKAVGGAILTLKGGMGKGLPLATPSQAGVLVQGTVLQSFGTWVGTDMSLSFIIVPVVFSYDTPGNIVFNWAQGTSLKSAIDSTLAIGYPTAPREINISPNLVATQADIGFFSTFSSFATHVQQLTQGLLGSKYGGVRMIYAPNKISIFDGTQTVASTQFSFFDFIGQPAWIDFGVIQVKTVLRGDIQLGNTVSFPQNFQSQPGATRTTANSQPAFAKYQSAIKGQFTVMQVRHIGNFRDTDGGSWASVFNCAANGNV